MRVEIRAAVALSCLGSTGPAQVAALREGRSGIAPAGPDCLVARADLPVGLIRGVDDSDGRAFTLLDRVVDEALAAGGLSHEERTACAIVVGTSGGVASLDELPSLRKIRRGEPWRAQMLCGGAGRLAAHTSSRLGSHGPLFTYTTACTSSGVALVLAARLLRSGLFPRALVVGHDLVMKVAVDGFRHLQLYSKTSCRPFDRDRDGIVLGEAVSAVLLEPAAERTRRFELLEGAIAHDASHIAAGSSDGLTAARVMTQALALSGVAPAELSAIKAHGTGTPTNDLSELRGLERAFAGRPPPFVSLKGYLGHTTASSSTTEMALWLGCLEAGFVPCSLGFHAAPEGTTLAPLQERLATDGRPGVHMFNAFGFGGSAVSYLVRDHGSDR